MRCKESEQQKAMAVRLVERQLKNSSEIERGEMMIEHEADEDLQTCWGGDADKKGVTGRARFSENLRS